MKPAAIRVGDVLVLKRERAEAYGMSPDEHVTVAELRRHAGYRTPWIIARNGDAYRPSDFAKAVTS